MPPPVLPEVGVTAVTVGLEAALTVIWSDDDVLDVPDGVVTVMWLVAAAWGGEIARMEVSDRIVKLTAGTVPNFTALAPVKFVPVSIIMAYVLNTLIIK